MNNFEKFEGYEKSKKEEFKKNEHGFYTFGEDDKDNFDKISKENMVIINKYIDLAEHDDHKTMVDATFKDDSGNKFEGVYTTHDNIEEIDGEYVEYSVKINPGTSERVYAFVSKNGETTSFLCDPEELKEKFKNLKEYFKED